jgi:DNA mismatch repair protein MutS2
MKTTSSDLLEFEALRELVARYVASPLGLALLREAAPHTDRERVEQALADVAEAIEYVQAASKPHPAVRGAAVRIRFDSLSDPTEALQKLRIEGTVLEAKEILQLTGLMDLASDVKRLLGSVAERFPRLAGRSREIGEFHSLVRDLAGKVLPDGTLADDASPALARLRRDIDRQRKLVQESLERFLRIHREENLLQEEFVTIRNDRFVVPVIAGRQRKIEGVIHGASGSGHTMFVEPLETIELNNELVRLSEEELREIHHILREMTASLRASGEAIAAAASVLGDLEFLFAKARFASDFDCTVPRFSPPEARRLSLREARHPLLADVLRRQKKPIIPVSLELTEDCRTLLISGPNTGGKTVTLKTVGLLALMAQAGFPVPCTEAEFPLFGQVLADIGDQQSIQESLSTFSAHICRVRDMLDAADSTSLVLLDELGRATDPEEGGALGVAVLERFRSAGAFTLSSTHLMALKVYGASTPGVVNASMGFDDETLRPTYVLKLGAPGKSAGLEIAKRLGMPDVLIGEAGQRLGNRERDLSSFLSDLHRRLDSLAAQEQELREMKDALIARQKSLATEWERREGAKLKELERRYELVLEKFDSQAQEAIERIVAEAERKKVASSAMRRVGGLKRGLREELEVTVVSTQNESRQGALETPKAQITEGVRVRLKNIREPARVSRKLAGGLIEVQAGFLKLQVSEDDVLEVLPDAGGGAGLPKQVTYRPAVQPAQAVQEINVIGQRAEEACDAVEKFLDNAVLAEATRVRIVHGHGMGILRRAIAELLAKNPNVEKFHAGDQFEGGAGATIVELKG